MSLAELVGSLIPGINFTDAGRCFISRVGVQQEHWQREERRLYFLSVAWEGRRWTEENKDLD